MIVARKALAASLAFMAFATMTVSASAAVVYRIEIDPEQPTVGEPTTIVVSTLFPAVAHGTPPEPQPLDDFPWTFVAESPRSARYEIALERLGSTGFQWTADFMFDEPGNWEIGLDRRHLGTPVDPALGARLPVEVRGPDEPTLPVTVIVAVAGVVAGAVLLAVGILRIRRRSSAGRTVGR